MYRGGTPEDETDYARWQPAKLYYAGRPRSQMRRMAEEMRRLGIKGWWDDPNYDATPRGTPDELITTRIEGRDYVELKQDAFRAHRTQIAPDSFVFAMPAEQAREFLGYEYYRLAQHHLPSANSLRNEGYEEDLLEGIPAS
jgi:LmbE family N-acetylglucosaminyl deacetylase